MPDTPSHPNSPETRDAAAVIRPLTNLRDRLERGALVIEEMIRRFRLALDDTLVMAETRGAISD